MANIAVYHATTGVVLYAQLWRSNPATGAIEIFDHPAGGWETPNIATPADYAITGSEAPASSYNYVFNIDAVAYEGFPNVPFEVRIFSRVGGAAAWADAFVTAWLDCWDPINNRFTPPALLTGQGTLIRADLRAVNGHTIFDPDEVGAQLGTLASAADFSGEIGSAWAWTGVPKILQVSTTTNPAGVRDVVTIDRTKRFRVAFDVDFSTIPVSGEKLYIGLFRPIAANINNLSAKLADDGDASGDSAKDRCVAGVLLTGNGAAVTAQAVIPVSTVGVLQYGVYSTSFTWGAFMQLAFDWDPDSRLLRLIDRNNDSVLYSWIYSPTAALYTSKALVESTDAIAFGAAAIRSAFGVTISAISGHGPGYRHDNVIPSAIDNRNEMDANSTRLSTMPKDVITRLFATTSRIDGKSFAWLVSRVAAALIGKTTGNTGSTATGQAETVRKADDSADAFAIATDANRNRTEFTDGIAPVVSIT